DPGPRAHASSHEEPKGVGKTMNVRRAPASSESNTELSGSRSQSDVIRVTSRGRLPGRDRRRGGGYNIAEMADTAAPLARTLSEWTREGELYERLPQNAVRCYACGHRCFIPEGRPG